ncbi:MAG: ATP synthase subunit A [Methanocellales archaeon]|nr:ATP synthase subunit A [Methanocellales archaeon]
MTEKGIITRVTGPVISAKNMRGSRMYELVRVGNERLIGEIIGLDEDVATIQVYEETGGVTPGEEVISTGMPLSVELGPGLLGKIYDGIQRPLDLIKLQMGDYIKRGVEAPALERDKKWEFAPVAKKGETMGPGDILGVVQETKTIEHRILVPPGITGKLLEIAPKGKYTIEETIAKIKTAEGVKKIQMLQKWPVRTGRPYVKKLDPSVPLITGQRVIDTFFPVAKGGTAAIPGPFGSGKTVVQQLLAKWADADVIVYVGCGERGNEMADVLREFPVLEDPRTGELLMNRTMLIANTSNMPVAARDASVYTGMTLAEYYRDMGYDVALMADSTSRWAEAMREISGRLEEMPGEEGYPAYLASRLADFYERSGRAMLNGKDEKIGSISVIGAVSPPGGDFSEPVTQNTLRITKVFWALDADLANKRHFPAINWLQSYSLYLDGVKDWWHKEVGAKWEKMRNEAMSLLQKESELQEIVQLVGPDALPESDQAALDGAKAIREAFLMQNAFHKVDTYCPKEKQYRMLEILLKFNELMYEAIQKDVPIERIRGLPVKEKLARMGTVPDAEYQRRFEEIEKEMEAQFKDMVG